MSRQDQVTYSGWVFKEGSLIKSWKKRFLVVKHRDLAYYKNTDERNQAQILGALTIESVEKLSDITNGLLIHGNNGRDLKIFTDTKAEMEKCYAAIAQDCRHSSGGVSHAPATHIPPPRRESSVDGSKALRRVGWLEKEGQNFHTWKKRYFVLDKDQISYAAQVNGDALGEGRVVAVRRDGSRPYTLEITLDSGRELRVGAKTEFEADDWLKAIRRAAVESSRSESSAHDNHARTSTNSYNDRPLSPLQTSPPAYAYEDDDPYALFGPGKDESSQSTATTDDSNLQSEDAKVESSDDPTKLFGRRIVLDDTSGGNQTFTEEKAFSPKAPGKDTILQMREDDRLLLQELEEERREAEQSHYVVDRSQLPAAQRGNATACACCILM